MLSRTLCHRVPTRKDAQFVFWLPPLFSSLPISEKKQWLLVLNSIEQGSQHRDMPRICTVFRSLNMS
jgi:hypothetical protein